MTSETRSPKRPTDRALTEDERRLLLWMLANSTEGAATFLPQVEKARALLTRCPCGCASLNLTIEGQPIPAGPIRPIVEFSFGEGDELCAVFAFEQEGILSGLEVYGTVGDAPKTLPRPEELR